MLKRLIFWEFPRGSWQYDIIVGLIVAFLFLTPRSWFRDQPRIPNVSVISIPNGEFMVDPDYWNAAEGSGAAGSRVKLTQEIRARAGNPHLNVLRVEKFVDSDGELRFYIAYTK